MYRSFVNAPKGEESSAECRGSILGQLGDVAKVDGERALGGSGEGVPRRKLWLHRIIDRQAKADDTVRRRRQSDSGPRLVLDSVGENCSC